MATLAVNARRLSAIFLSHCPPPPPEKKSAGAPIHPKVNTARTPPAPRPSPCRAPPVELQPPVLPCRCFPSKCAHAMPNSLLLSAQHCVPQLVAHSRAQVPLQAHDGEIQQVRALEPARATAFDGTFAPQSPCLQLHGRNRTCGTHHGTEHDTPHGTHH